MKRQSSSKTLRDLKNVGPATLHDLKILGIHSLEQLAQANPDDLYLKLEQLTHLHQDSCVWDIFAAIIHEAQTGEASPWWHWTPKRKKRFLKITLCNHIK